IIFFVAQTEWLSPYILETILYYNTAILIFNLLPIWPLDGGKLLLLYLSMKFPYKKAYNNKILFSLIGSCLFVCFQYLHITISSILIMIFLIMENRKEWKHRHYVFMRFLLNRYEGITQLKKVQPIYVSDKDKLMDVFTLFKRDKT